MTTVALAKKKWARKVKGSVWKKGVTGKSKNYCDGIAEFLGVSTCAADKARAFGEGTDAVSAADFDRATKGKEDKWARRYKEVMAG